MFSSIKALARKHRTQTLGERHCHATLYMCRLCRILDTGLLVNPLLGLAGQMVEGQAHAFSFIRLGKLA